MNILADEFSRQQSLSSIKREIVNAYQKAIETDKLFKSLDQKFTEQYKTLVLGMTQNFQKRNITIIEFTDFFESYRTSVLQLNQIQNSRLDAFETLNFRIGTDLINP
jgi:cobalt-zinc-cadmium efflux system outer membrane protein